MKSHIPKPSQQYACTPMILRLLLRWPICGALTLPVVSALIFRAVELLPGGIATEMQGQSATPETLTAFRDRNGLNGPARLRHLHWLGGWFEMAASRLVDVLVAVPELIFALLALSISGTLVIALALVIAVLDSTRVYRLARAVAQVILTIGDLEVARMRGEGLGWIIRREVLPNASAPLIAEFGLRFCFVFLFIPALSFLGLQPPTADRGAMVRESARPSAFANRSSWQAAAFGPAPLLPAGAVALLMVAVNLAVDWTCTSPAARRNDAMTRLFEIRDLRIAAHMRKGATEIILGVDLVLNRGQILGLIGESAASKSALGLAATGHVKPGYRITNGSIRFDGQELAGASAAQLRQVQGRCIAYVAQSSAAAFNPAWRLMSRNIAKARSSTG